MEGDVADQAERERNNSVIPKIASICGQADGEGDLVPARPGEVRFCVGLLSDEVRCNQPISEARLRAVPKTRLCVSCREKAEPLGANNRWQSQAFSAPYYNR